MTIGLSSRFTLRLSAALIAGATTFALPASGSAQKGSESAGPVYVMASIDVLPQNKSKGEAVIRAYVAQAKADKRLTKVWFLEEQTTPNHFEVIELMPTKQVYIDHQAQRYVIDYRDRLAPMLGSPYDEQVFTEAKH